MYAWIWGRLPGPKPLRAVVALLLAAAVLVVCFVWLFPWVAAHLPIDDLDQPAHAAGGQHWRPR